MNTEQLFEFWEARPNKIWVVYLHNNKTKPRRITDKVIVRAKTAAAALITAKKNSVTFRARRAFGTACLAHPERDLSCVRTQVLSRYDSNT